VTYEDMANTILLEQGVVQRKYSAARVSEDDVDSLVGKRSEDDF